MNKSLHVYVIKNRIKKFPFNLGDVIVRKLENKDMSDGENERVCVKEVK